MKKISGNPELADHVGKYVNIYENGEVRKFLVKSVDKESILSNVSFLNTDSSIVGESANQRCDICEDACIYNTPILKVAFSGGGNFTKGYMDERWGVYLNNFKIGVCETSAISNGGQIWFVPNANTLSASTNYIEDVTYSMGYLSTNYVMFKECSLLYYNLNEWNSLCIVPEYANNPVEEFGVPNATFYGVPSMFLDIHKRFDTSTATDILSCPRWNMYNFCLNSNTNCHPFPNIIPSELNHIFPDTVLSANSIYQPISSYFVYMNPCSLPYIEGYPLFDEKYYRTNRNLYSLTAYQWPDVAYPALESYSVEYGIETNRPSAPLLNKFTFYTNCSSDSIVTLYYGANKKSFLGIEDNNYDGIFFTDLGVTPYEGTFYILSDMLDDGFGRYAFSTSAIQTGGIYPSGNPEKIYTMTWGEKC